MTETTTVPPASVNGFVLYGMTIDGVEQIFALAPGGESQFITTGRLLYGQALSPGGTRVVINTDAATARTRTVENVAIVDLQTKTITPLSLVAYPTNGIFWSPDEHTLLYIVRAAGDKPVDQLVQYNLITGENTILSEMEQILTTAGWSTDGQTIAFIATASGQYDLFAVNSLTLAQQQMTNTPVIETLLAWRPASQQLLVGTVMDERSAFEGWPWGLEQLFLIDSADANTEPTLLLEAILTSESVSWSPDGKQLAMERAGQLCFFDVKSLSELCPAAEAPFYEDYAVAFQTRPVWSPDGQWLTFFASQIDCLHLHFWDVAAATVIPGDLGCDRTEVSSSSPIYWAATGAP